MRVRTRGRAGLRRLSTGGFRLRLGYPGALQDADGTNETLNVDLSTSYEVNDHLTISLEGLNLTDEANDQFTDTHANRVVVYTHTGRQVFLGARYKF